MKPVVLAILDGFGIDNSSKLCNAVKEANTKNIDKYLSNYPNSLINASEEFVGLPKGQMGNSEVGHLNLGCGKVVYQSLSKVNNSINDDYLKDNEHIKREIKYAKENNKKVHVIGLLSDGGVHSHIDLISYLVNTFKNEGLNTYHHAILDGRDVEPKTAVKFMEQLGNEYIATVSGRYYAMDRDNNYDRIQLAYDAMYNGIGEVYNTPKEGVDASYSNEVYDEYIKPFIVNKDGLIDEGDVVVFANFRPDRAIQLSKVISNSKTTPINNKVSTNLIIITNYSQDVLASVIFPSDNHKNTLGDVISENGLKQLRIAETEKYAHVTFFFDGGVDREIKGSKRILVNSPKVEKYSDTPLMSIEGVTQEFIENIQNFDVAILNFANCDMVGHTGNMDAAIKAVEAVDKHLGIVVDKVQQLGGTVLITADHGNAEQMCNDDGEPFTSHTTNLVPFIITNDKYKVNTGSLCDVAPTMLDLLNIDKPVEMTGNSLIIKK